jgi:hypothetical protein
MSLRITASIAAVAVGSTRPIELRLNQFTLSGDGPLSGTVLVPSSNGYLLGGVFPATGLGFNAGVPDSASLEMGTLYGLSPVTFTVTGYPGQQGLVSVRVVSGGSYTITIEFVDL